MNARYSLGSLFQHLITANLMVAHTPKEHLATMVPMCSFGACMFHVLYVPACYMPSATIMIGPFKFFDSWLQGISDRYGINSQITLSRWHFSKLCMIGLELLEFLWDCAQFFALKEYYWHSTDIFESLAGRRTRLVSLKLHHQMNMETMQCCVERINFTENGTKYLGSQNFPSRCYEKILSLYG
jgi:hypothetical protein